MTPAEYIAELALNLHRLPPHLGAWLAAGLSKYRRGLDLDEALGIDIAGARDYRNRCLRRAAALLPTDNRREQARLLCLAVKQYEIAARRASKNPELIDTMTGVKLEVVSAALSGARMPQSVKQMRRILDWDIEGGQMSRADCDT